MRSGFTVKNGTIQDATFITSDPGQEEEQEKRSKARKKGRSRFRSHQYEH